MKRIFWIIIGTILTLSLLAGCSFPNPKNLCNVASCKNPRMGDWTTLCSEHGCHYPGCSYSKDSRFDYCTLHKCGKSECPNPVSAGSLYCTDHEKQMAEERAERAKYCANPSCSNPVAEGSRFCEKHKCSAEGCPNPKYLIKGSIYCSDHTCENPNCTNFVTGRHEYCSKHKGSGSNSSTKNSGSSGSKNSGSRGSKDRDDAEALFEDYPEEFDDIDEAEEYFEEEYEG